MTPQGLQRLRGSILISCVGLLMLMRLRTWSEPPETDLSTYWVVAQELLHGKRLYADVWDIKPPAVYWIYALAALWTTNPFLARYVLWTIATVLTLIGVFLLSKKLFRSERAAITSAVIWTLVAADCLLQANQPNVEVFMNTCVVWAMVFLLATVQKRQRTLMAFLAGTLLGLGCLLKTVMVPHVALLGAAWVYHWQQKQLGEKRRLVFYLLVFAVGVILPCVICLTVFIVQNTTYDAYLTLVQWGAEYSKNPLANVISGLSPLRLLPQAALNVLPTIILAGIGIYYVIGWSNRETRLWLGAWACSTFLAYSLPGRFYPHYYQLWLPFWCILAGTAICTQRHFWGQSGGRWMYVLVGALVFCQVLTQAPFYLRPPELWSYAKYGPGFVNEAFIGKQLREFLHPTERLYVWGTAPTLYESAQRRPASGIFFCIPVLWGPTTQTLTRRTLQDFQRTPPELLVMDTRDVPAPASHPIIRWFYHHYWAHPALPKLDRFRLFCRKNGELQKRLEESEATLAD